MNAGLGLAAWSSNSPVGTQLKFILGKYFMQRHTDDRRARTPPVRVEFSFICPFFSDIHQRVYLAVLLFSCIKFQLVHNYFVGRSRSAYSHFGFCFQIARFS